MIMIIMLISTQRAMRICHTNGPFVKHDFQQYSGVFKLCRQSTLLDDSRNKNPRKKKTGKKNPRKKKPREKGKENGDNGLTFLSSYTPYLAHKIMMPYRYRVAIRPELHGTSRIRALQSRVPGELVPGRQMSRKTSNIIRR